MDQPRNYDDGDDDAKDGEEERIKWEINSMGNLICQ